MAPKTLVIKRADELFVLGLTLDGASNSYTYEDINVHWTEMTTLSEEQWDKLVNEISAELDKRRIYKNTKLDLTEKDIKFLVELSRKLRTQDNRGTDYPMFVVQENRKVYAEYNQDWDGAERKEDIEPDDMCEKCIRKYKKNKDINEYCEDCDSDQFNYWKLEDTFNLNPGAFLTAEACDRHIAQNDYHYRIPRSYGISTWRNNEMQQLIILIRRLSEHV